MNEHILHTAPVLVAGNGNLTCSIAVCLLEAGHHVSLCTDDAREALAAVQAHLHEMRPDCDPVTVTNKRLKVLSALKDAEDHPLAIAITPEDSSIKQDMIRQLEDRLSPHSIIAINTECVGLHALQQEARHPQRVCGMNWVEPAHTTRFLEMIRNATVKEGTIARLSRLAAEAWGKDPYTVEEFGIRSRLMSAMAREAFYLVQHGYASVEDIDRACRNDAGYYLPFAGNCRYMDLMGTYAYGVVMKDLNPDLCKDRQLPAFFSDMVKEGKLGMQTGKGIYDYTAGEAELWKTAARKFSYEIRQLMNKYPFNYKQNDNAAEGI